MDYPLPKISIAEIGEALKLTSDAYMTEIGIFDKIAVDLVYRKYNSDDFEAYLVRNHKPLSDAAKYSEEGARYLLAVERLADAEVRFNYRYMNDQDVANGDYRATAWDSGEDPIYGTYFIHDLSIPLIRISLIYRFLYFKALDHALKVRSIAVAKLTSWVAPHEVWNKS